MGRFLTSQHILNAENLTKAQFKKIFSDAVKKKGYVTCNENSAEISYTLVFPKDRKWVSVLNPDYQPGAENVLKDAGFFAEALKTNVISVGLVDSDFAELKLFDSSGKLADTLILGESYMDEPSSTGEKDFWQPLLTENSTWEQVTEIQNGSYTFTEDALGSFAPLIGMDSKQILLDCKDVGDNATMMHFKKAGEKKLTLNSAFKQVFGEALEPLGFAKAKSKYPYYVRVIGNEIVQVVAVKEEFENTFDIVSGIATVYRAKIDLSQSVKYNTNWLMTIANYYSCLKYYDTDYDDDYRRRMMFFNFNLPTNDDKINIFNYALEQFKMWVLPTFNKINSVKIAYENFQKRYFGVISTKLYNDYENTKTMNEDESLTLFSFDEPYEIIDKMFKKSMEQIDFVFKHNKEGYGEEYFKARHKNSMLFEKSQKETLNKILNCEENYQKILDERERRKKANIERLRSYGIMI